MSTDVTISQWTNRIHDHVIDHNSLLGLERVNSDLTSVVLQDAMTKLGIGPTEYLCVQEVSVPVMINLSRSTRSQSRRWGESLCQQLMLNRQRRDGATIYYHSLCQVHFACAEGILRDDLSDLWAWQQVGVIAMNNQDDFSQSLMQWSEQSRTRGVFQVALWRYLLRSPLLSVIQLRFNKRHWRLHLDGLAAAMSVQLAPIEAVVRQVLQPSASYASDMAQTLGGETSKISVAEKSLPALLRELSLLAALFQQSADGGLSLVCIAMLVAEPSIGHLTSAKQSSRIKTICASLNLMRDGFSGKISDHNAPSMTKELAAAKNTGIQDRPHANRDQNILIKPREGKSGSSKTDDVASGQLHTAYGGLFWLINPLLKSPELVDQLAAIGVDAGLPQQWVWLWLVREILPSPQCPSAAMVFAGVETIEEYDELTEAVPDFRQEQQIATIAAELMDLFLVEIGMAQDQDRDQLIDLMQCNVSINRDGAWVEITYAANAVNIDVRRAGVDIDPGFVHWLGQIVRFNYA